MFSKGSVSFHPSKLVTERYQNDAFSKDPSFGNVFLKLPHSSVFLFVLVRTMGENASKSITLQCTVDTKTDHSNTLLLIFVKELFCVTVWFFIV